MPIWIGGHSEAALRRVARLGDGWQPSAIPPEEYGPLAKRLHVLLERVGRGPGAISLTAHVRLVFDRAALGEDVQYVQRPDRSLLFVGAPHQVVRFIRRYEQLGVTHLSADVTMSDSLGTLEGRVQAMDIMASEVMPQFASASS
jgi:alkanesulfonate monooxygenase SsuD/methylene tetrahydromethanopterin reductase-like flavin-dependent oxidoreductase (luciferase family)